MFFFRKGKEKVESGAKKVDKIITGLVIGTAVASMIGLSRTKKGKEIINEVKEEVKKSGFFAKLINIFKRKNNLGKK